MATNNSNEQIRNISIQDRQSQNTAADWARQLRFSSDVNKSTVGVDTDRVTPDLLMAASKKLLGISRGQQQGDAKDSLRYQKVYGPVEYFAQHVQRDGGAVARSLLWKATNKGNLDFIGSGSLQPHVSSVFNESNLTRFIDNSTPFQGVDASMLLTRVGQGGINSDQSAPIEMRLVQPSYYGYVGGVRTQDKSPGITAYLSKNVMKGTDGKLYQRFYNPRTGKEQLVDSQKAASSVVTTNQYMNTKDKYVYALGGDKGVRIVPRSSIDYILPRADEAWSTAANVVPMMSGVKSLRLNMGCLHPQTPVPFIDEQGFTDLVPAKRLGSYGDTYLYGCDQKGYEKLYKLQGVYSRFPDFNRSFKRVITASGRVLVTSPDHKWYVYQGGKYKKITADKLSQGMLIPRSTFFKLPSRLTTIFGVTITKEICVLVGRLLKSYEETPKTRRFTYVVNETVNQQSDIIEALKQLNIIGSNFYQRDDIHYVSITDVRLIDWIETEMKSKQAQRKIPKAILSLPKGMTSYVLDSYCKQRENVGEDIFGDIWLLDIPSPIMRDGLSLMLGKIYTDTYYRDSYKNGKQYRALKLIESENQGTVYLQPIKKILDQPAPAFMVDLDCGDNVYAVGNGIITHNSKYISQAVALQNPEAPLVRSLDEASGKDMDTLIGKFVGAQFAPKPGIVQAVRKDRIDMLYDDGTKGSVGLYDNFPANAKGWLSNYPMVKAGQRVGQGQLLAKSNYTDDKGVAAMGRNLHIGYMSYHGGTYEDACTISESAAKKMAYTTMYKTGMDTDKSIRSSKTLYNAWKPGQYTKQQMQKLDDKGVVKVGQVLHKGDPMILGIRTNQPSPGTMGKRILTDVSQVWDHAHQGVVTDVVRTRDGIKVYAKVSAPLQVGDKISGRWGNKGTIAQIIPDDKMPRDQKGVPLDVLMDPLGIVSRCYDQVTQFLTQQGWKKGSQLDKIQELLTYFPQSDTCRFTRQEDYMYSTNYTGTMYKVDNKAVSFCVTKNHTVFCRTDKQFKTVPVQDIYKEHIWLPTGQVWVQVKPEDWSDIYVADQKVYCPTVSTGFVATRRNGKIVVLGNTNPSQLIQAGLGKLSMKTGQPIVVPQFMPKGQSRLQWAKQLLKKNNISMHQTVFDPDTNKNVSNVFTGYMYFLPLKHIADTKMSARGTDTYTAQGIPAGGGQQGCFPAMQNIMTIHGERSIATICQKRIPQYVLSWDQSNKTWCYKQIIDWFGYKSKKSDILQIVTDKGSIYPTKNHKMYKADGVVCLAQQLKVGDMLRSFTGSVFIKQIKTSSNQAEINVYDFTVKDTHNYCLTGGINVSNSKRIGGLQVAGLVGHNAFDFLTTDAKLIRGQSNAQFWRSLRTGEIPVIPGQPLVHKKFFAHLQGAGMHIRKTPKGISIMALTNKDVDDLAGSRQLKSKDTYQQKTFREIDGGLFGKDIFGTDGNKWGYIQLDDPLPNPVMQEPLARLLRMSDQQFQNVVSGKQEVNGLKNSSDIQKALSKIDLKAQRVNALKQLKEASASKRDAALKRYVAIARMQDNGTKPADYMLNKIPVLPPEFRPITTQGNLTMVADSNYLYAQLLDARDDQREARNLTPQLQNEARGNIYKRWKQLVGLYDPQSKKLQSKSVKGLLRWALGTTPKFGGFQRKVLGSTVDTVGRGVVVPDSKLKLNQIGLPQAIAWNIYSPFISRKLVQSGYTPVDALKLTKEKNVRAKEALMQAMQEHPTVMNRAPSLHKLSLMGFQPVLTTGYAIKVNPSIVSPFGMDFDGDSVWNKVQIYTDLRGLVALIANSQKKDMLQYLQNKKERCSEMLSTDTKIKVAHAVCSLSDIPHKEGSDVVKSATVTEWDVDGDFYVNTIDPATGNTVLARMTKVSRHTGLKMYDCTLSISKAYSHVVTASEDHSLITLNPTTLELEKTKPSSAVGRCVPVLRRESINDSDTCLKYIKLGKTYPMSYDMGMLLGMMIGDGWVDNELKAKIACCEPNLQQYILKFTEPRATMPFTKQAKYYSYAPDKDRFGQEHNQELFLLPMDKKDRLAIQALIGSGAFNKRIPLISFCGSRAHLIGILCGLLATDGHIGISATGAKKATIKNIAYHTISPDLRDGIQLLCNKLGIKTRVTPYKGANSKATCYAIGFCLEDIAELKAKYPNQFIIPVAYKEAALKKICADISKGVKNSFDIVPFPRGLFCEFSWAKVATIHKDTVVAARAKGYIKRRHAEDIAKAMKTMSWDNYIEPSNLKTSDKSGHTAQQAKDLVFKWIKLVEDRTIGWEIVDSVTESTITEGWDCTVPGPYTFTLSTGTVVQDTVNIHVPVSKAAIKEVRNNMFPQRNLISARKHKILYAPQKAFMQGLYVATRMGDSSKGVKTFHSIQQAKQAYKNNQIDIDTPIVISK